MTPTEQNMQGTHYAVAAAAVQRRACSRARGPARVASAARLVLAVCAGAADTPRPTRSAGAHAAPPNKPEAAAPPATATPPSTAPADADPPKKTDVLRNL